MVSVSEGVNALPLRDLQTPTRTSACSPILKNQLALERQPAVASLSPAPVNAFRRVCVPLVVSCVRPGVCTSAVHLSAEGCHPTLGFPRLPTVTGFVACFDRAFLLVPAPTPAVFSREPKGAQPGTTYERALRPTRASAASPFPTRPPRPDVLVPLCPPLFATFRLFFRACALFFFVNVTTRDLSGFFATSLAAIRRQTRVFVHFALAIYLSPTVIIALLQLLCRHVFVSLGDSLSFWRQLIIATFGSFAVMRYIPSVTLCYNSSISHYMSVTLSRLSMHHCGLGTIWAAVHRLDFVQLPGASAPEPLGSLGPCFPCLRSSHQS